MGLAIANDSDQPIAATLTVYDQSNDGENPPDLATGYDPSRSTVTKFVDEITGWRGALGVVTISAPTQPSTSPVSVLPGLYFLRCRRCLLNEQPSTVLN